MFLLPSIRLYLRLLHRQHLLGALQLRYTYMEEVALSFHQKVIHQLVRHVR